MLDVEIFKESLKGQFKESIKMAIEECYSDYHNTLNINLLHDKLNILQRFALKDGFKKNEWDDLVYSLCPSLYTQSQNISMAA